MIFLIEKMQIQSLYVRGGKAQYYQQMLMHSYFFFINGTKKPKTKHNCRMCKSLGTLNIPKCVQFFLVFTSSDLNQPVRYVNKCH